MAELKQAAKAKISMSQILIQKRAHQIVKHGHHQTAHFFMGQNDYHLGDAVSFNYVSSSPLTHLKITNGSLCHVVVDYPTPSEGWGHGGTPWSPRSRATLQGLDQRS